MKKPLIVVLSILGIVVISIIFLIFSCQRVSGGVAMKPTINTDDKSYVFKLSYLFNQPTRGDIVVFKDTTGNQMIERVIGISGDIIDIRSDGFVYINGRKLIELYIVESNKPQGYTYRLNPAEGVLIKYPYKILQNQIFLLGDNRSESKDSRIFGAIDLSKVIGKVFAVTASSGENRNIDEKPYLQ